MTIVLKPGSVPLKNLAEIYWNNGCARLDPSSDTAVLKAAAAWASLCRKMSCV